MNKLYTPQEVSELLQLHYQTVLAEIHRGNLKAFRLKGQYRVSEEQIQDYLQTHIVKDIFKVAP
jgi:excisionase family DNA binding protein